MEITKNPIYSLGILFLLFVGGCFLSDFSLEGLTFGVIGWLGFVTLALVWVGVEALVKEYKKYHNIEVKPQTNLPEHFDGRA